MRIFEDSHEPYVHFIKLSISMYQNIWYIDAKTTANTLDYTGLATIEFVVGSFIKFTCKTGKTLS